MNLDYNTRLAAIQRNEKLAQIMQQQAFQPVDIQSYQGIQAPISPLSGLAKVLQAYMGAKGTGEEERIKLLREHATRLLGYLPKGVIRNDKDLDELGVEFKQEYAKRQIDYFGDADRGWQEP